MTLAIENPVTRYRRWPTGLAIALGAATLGSLDLLFAYAFWAGSGVSLMRILQSIASGVLGRASFSAGVASATLGAVLHYMIAGLMVLAYCLAARRRPSLARHPWRFGPLYGLVLYVVMNLVVVPLSAAGSPSLHNLPWVLSSIVVHVLFGTLCAATARFVRRS